MKKLDLVFRDYTRHTMPWRGLIVRAFHVARPWLKIPKGHTTELGVQIV